MRRQDAPGRAGGTGWLGFERVTCWELFGPDVAEHRAGQTGRMMDDGGYEDAVRNGALTKRMPVAS